MQVMMDRKKIPMFDEAIRRLADAAADLELLAMMNANRGEAALLGLASVAAWEASADAARALVAFYERSPGEAAEELERALRKIEWIFDAPVTLPSNHRESMEKARGILARLYRIAEGYKPGRAARGAATA